MTRALGAAAMDTTWAALEDADRLCAHCASVIPSGAPDAYCCEGCRTVAALIRGSGLDRYYALGGGGAPVALREPSRDRAWLEPIAAQLAAAGGIRCVELDVQGMHCAGCVWLLGALLDRTPGGVEAIANASLGRVALRVEPSFDLAAFVDAIERFGYRVGPPLKQPSAARDELLVRTGVAIGLAANAMMFALAIYLGLREGALFTLMRTLELALAIAAVAVGAPVFVRGAIEGLRRGVLHLDLPIALGMLLALAGSVWAFAAGADAAYADTVAIFVALMLLGRWLQSRAVARNRDRLLRSEGAGGLSARRIEAGTVQGVRAEQVREGDLLLVAPGEIAVVEGALEEPATISLDWISGESEPRSLGAGDPIGAGAINRGASAFTMRAATGFDRSPLGSLLGRGESGSESRASSPFWDRVSRVYVAAVIAAATIVSGLWLAASSDPTRALEIATAILVVTCPCGIGIATPLGYEIVTSALRRRGLFVRRERALDRAAEIGRVAFDKTGTLTTGRLELASPEALEALETRDRAALADLVARSAHPKSEAIRRAWSGPLAVRDGTRVLEVTGRGVHARIGGEHYRLGAPEWALPIPMRRLRGDLVFSRDGEVLLDLVTREVPRSDAAAELHALAREGYDLAILSGDGAGRVASVVRRLDLDGIPALSECTPEDKARWIEEHDERATLFVGDGINDGPAADRAALSGTPAIDRPFLPARTDFFFVTPGLAPIRALLQGARALRRVARRNLAFAIAYNTIAVALAAAGLMRPWLAAILMPASSLAVIAATTWSLRESRWSGRRGAETRWTS